jgi:hypothetical protein
MRGLEPLAAGRRMLVTRQEAVAIAWYFLP